SPGVRNTSGQILIRATGRLSTVIVTALEIVSAPVSSQARAVRIAVPAGGLVQIKEKGAEVAAPNLAVRLKNSTFTMWPSESRASTVMGRKLSVSRFVERSA